VPAAQLDRLAPRHKPQLPGLLFKLDAGKLLQAARASIQASAAAPGAPGPAAPPSR
jgi:hypothetical protein